VNLPDGIKPEQVWEPRGAMAELWRARDPMILIEGPAGTGKTTACLMKIYAAAEKYPGMRALLTRDTKASLAESVLKTFEHYVLGLDHPLVMNGPSRDYRKSYNLANGSSIVCVGLDRPSRTFSAEYDIVFVGEAIETTREQVELLLRTLRNGKMPYSQLICDTNPGDPAHWLNVAANAGQFRRLVTRHADNPIYHDGTDWTPAGLTYLNDKLGRMTGANRRRMLLGEWVQAEGVIYDLFDREIHMRAREGPWRRTIIAVDDGHSAEFAALRLHVGKDGHRHVSGMVYLPSMIEHDKIGAVRALAKDYPRCEIIVDSAAAALIEAFRQDGMTVHGADKTDRLGGIQRVRDLLRVRSDGTPGITFDPSCSALANEMGMYVWDKTTAGVLTDRPKKGHDHALDALRYGVWHLSSSAAAAADAELIESLRMSVASVGAPRQSFRLEPVRGFGPETDRLLHKRDRSAYRIKADGPWRFWGEIDDDGRPVDHAYVMAVAPGLGVPGDDTYVCIADAHLRRVVADARFAKVAPDMAARQCIMAAMEFRNAFMVVKAAGAGAGFLTAVSRLGYGPLYRHAQGQTINDKYGWQWTAAGSLALLAEYRDAVIGERFTEAAMEAVDDLEGWIIHPEGYAAPASIPSNRTGTSAASVSDRAWASMLACHGIKFCPPKVASKRNPAPYSPEWCDKIADGSRA